MKKLSVLLLVLFLSSGFALHSQVLISLILGDKLNSEELEFGLEGGGNFSSIIGMDSKKYVSDWNIGFYFVYHLKKSWYVNTGVLVKAKMGSGKLTQKDLDFLGVNFPDSCLIDDGDYAQKINAFIVPAMARYMFKNRIYVEMGLQASLRYKAWVEYNSKNDDRSIHVKEFNKKMTNPIDVGALAGVGYRFNKKRTGMTLGVKYYYGFANVYKGEPGTHNNSLFLKLNIPIGAGEKAQKKREEKAKQRAAKKAQKEAQKNK
jgi:hypothetical protein